MTARIALPKTPSRRISPDSAWPIRRADGQTPAQTRQHYSAAATPRIPLQPMPEPRRSLVQRLLGRLGT